MKLYNNTRWTTDEQLYEIAEHFQGEVTFFKEELEFLDHLIRQYLPGLAGTGGIDRFSGFADRIKKMTLKLTALEEFLSGHLHSYALQQGKIIYQDEKIYREEHDRLEEQFSTLFQAYRKLKKDIIKVFKEIR